jgi:membrane protein implicated in regulation of membrane protease activity
VLVALVNPGLHWVVIATALVAASLFGSTNSRGVVGGLVGAAVLLVVLTVTGAMQWGWWAALAVAAVAVAGRLLSTGAEPPVEAERQPEALTG